MAKFNQGIYCSKLKLVLYTAAWVVVVIIVVLATFYGKQCPPSTEVPKPTEAQPWRNLRLTENIVPIHYDITLFPDIYENDVFNGNVSIKLEVRKETRHVLIHSKNLTIVNTRVRSMTTAVGRRKRTSSELALNRAFYYEPNQFWVIELKESVPSVIAVDLQFQGSLSNGIVGFYKSYYLNSITNLTSVLATSKFEPVDARKAFPCLDEPNLKATFTVTLIHRSGYIALSNMPVALNRNRPDGNIETVFEKSVKMSTYLVCFIVCDFQYKEKTTKEGKPFRVYATPDMINHVDYALDIGVHIHDLYERLYNLSYPLPKQDMIAIPNFVSGAMEHWGLISYRETALLYDFEQSSSFNKLRVASVVSHELAHQWFGNIVTMDWWDDLWLNEGFASFMEYKGVMSYHKDWDMGDQFLVRDMQRVMTSDARVSSHPIVVPVNHPNEITEVFDSISYSKGASVIRMLENVMGEKNFMTGIQTYLKRFAYSNAITEDLWNELDKQQEAEMKPRVNTFMDTWTRQMGFPVIRISFSGSKIKATQSRFLSNPNSNSSIITSIYNFKWWVPLKYVTSSGLKGFHWLKPSEDLEIESPIVDYKTEWVKFNAGQYGFYRVNYPNTTWDLLTTTLIANPRDLSPSDRSGLLDDAFSLAEAGHVSYKQALSLTDFLYKEDHYVPWSTALYNLRVIDDRLSQAPAYGKWEEFMLQLSRPMAEKLGWKTSSGDSNLNRQLRYKILTQMCGSGGVDALNNASSRLHDWMKTGKEIDPEIRSIVYSYGIKGSTHVEWDFMWQKYLTSPSPQDRKRLLHALTYSTEVWILTRLLNRALDPKLVLDQDFFYMVHSVANNPDGLNIAWEWVQEHWTTLNHRFLSGSRNMGRLVPGIVSAFSTDYRLDQVKEFFRKQPDVGAGGRARTVALDKIQANINWRKMYEDDISDWLNERLP